MTDYIFAIENKEGIKLSELSDFLCNALTIKVINDKTPVTANEHDQLNIVRIIINETGIHFITE